MDKKILEVCVDSVESAIAAEKGGADRLELCSNLVIGGTTPSMALYQAVRKHTSINIHVLLRPRFGDFCYTDHEFEILQAEVKAFCQASVDGIVIGILTSQGDLDVKRMKQLIDIAKPCSITLHRAFDVCREPFTALEEAVHLGIDTILTSGQQPDCKMGQECLYKLHQAANDRITIMAGAGVDIDAIECLRETGICTYHMSGKSVLQSPMKYRNSKVNMGIPGMDEFEIYRTDANKIAEAKKAL